MSHLLTAPDMLATAATDVDGIASAISAANAAAAGPTSSVLAAANDEVSAAIARIFGAYGQEYQAIVKQAAAFHHEFTRALAAAANAYTRRGRQRRPGKWGGIERVGRDQRADPVAVGAAGGQRRRVRCADDGAVGAAGGSGGRVDHGRHQQPAARSRVRDDHQQQVHPTALRRAIPQGLFTPEQFWPVTPISAT